MAAARSEMAERKDSLDSPRLTRAGTSSFCHVIMIFSSPQCDAIATHVLVPATDVIS